MIALYQANPHAFRDIDLGRIRAGVWLDIPSSGTVADIPPTRAAAPYRRHIEPDVGDGSPGDAADIDVAADDSDAGDKGASERESGMQTAGVSATAAVDDEGRDRARAAEAPERG